VLTRRAMLVAPLLDSASAFLGLSQSKLAYALEARSPKDHLRDRQWLGLQRSNDHPDKNLESRWHGGGEASFSRYLEWYLPTSTDFFHTSRGIRVPRLSHARGRRECERIVLEKARH
jgi:hypothetical protein